MNTKEKQIPAKITNPDYLKDLFTARIKDIDKEGTSILSLESYKIKDYFGDDFFHFVLQNNVRVGTQSGLRKRYKIFCISFSGHRRKKMYQVLELAYKNGFDKGEAVVPRPLWYIDDLMSVFYVGVPGDNFLEHIKNGYLSPPVIKKIASGLSRFHHIKPPRKIKLKKHKFTIDYLDPTGIIKHSHNKNSQFDQAILKQFAQLKRLQTKIGSRAYYLSHGDFHPENVIINQFNTEQIAIIDFSESCLAPVYYDIASFLQQLEFMTLAYLNQEEYAKLAESFLTSYFGQAKLDKNIKNNLNLYQSWTALKSAVYFMIFEDEVNRKHIGPLIQKSIELSNLI